MFGKDVILAIEIDNARHRLERCEEDLEEALVAWLKAKQALAEAIKNDT